MSSRARNKLNIKQVSSFTKPGIYSDGGGLYLRVREAGRSWFFIGTHAGKRFEMGLGSAQDVGLAKARERAAEVRAQLIDGINPLEKRKKATADQRDAVTFGKFATDYLASIEDGFKNPKHRQQWRNTLANYAQPIWAKPIAEIATADVLAILQPIWLSKAETASRVRGRLERVLDAAKVNGLREGDNPARAKGHLELLLPKRGKSQVRHHPALPFADLPEFMAQLRKREGVAAQALEFSILTAARSGETRGMIWREVDLKNSIWTVPKERMKAEREHQVPLSKAAMAVLAAANAEGLKPDDFVFPAPRGGQLSDMTLSALLKRMSYSDITVHGFRSTFRDWAGEKTDFSREVIEFSLAHGLPDPTERAYRRASALDKRRELMDAWATLCSAIPSETDAVDP